MILPRKKNVMKNIVEIGITIINNTEKIPFKQFLVYKIVLNHKITMLGGILLWI